MYMLKESKGYYGRWVMVTGDHVKAEKQREVSGGKGKGKRKRRKKSGGEGVFIVFQWLKDRKVGDSFDKKGSCDT